MAFDPFSPKAAENFLEGAATAAKWPKIGYVVEGTVTDYSMAQCLHYDSSEALYWEGKSKVEESKAVDKSRPVMQMLLVIQGKPTGETWESINNVRKALPDDDGVRTAYVKGNLQRALKDALRKSGGKLETGAYVRIERVADGVQSNPKFAPPHDYSAVWTPANDNAAAAAFLSTEDPTKNPFEA